MQFNSVKCNLFAPFQVSFIHSLVACFFRGELFKFQFARLFSVFQSKLNSFICTFLCSVQSSKFNSSRVFRSRALYSPIANGQLGHHCSFLLLNILGVTEVDIMISNRLSDLQSAFRMKLFESIRKRALHVECNETWYRVSVERLFEVMF